MNAIKIDPQNIEIAVQTVLHNYKGRLENLVHTNDLDLLKEMAQEITRRAAKFQDITNLTLEQLERS